MTDHKKNGIILYWLIDDIEARGHYTGKEIELVIAKCEQHLTLMKEQDTDFHLDYPENNSKMLSEYFEKNIDELRKMYEDNTLPDYTAYMNLNLVKHYAHKYCSHYGHTPYKDERPDFAKGEEFKQNLYI